MSEVQGSVRARLAYVDGPSDVATSAASALPPESEEAKESKLTSSSSLLPPQQSDAKITAMQCNRSRGALSSTTSDTKNDGEEDNASAKAIDTFTPAQRLAIRSEYARGERLRLAAISEAVASGAVEARVEEIEAEARALRRRRVEVARAVEDLCARRFLLQTGCLLADGDGAVAEKLIASGPIA